MNRLPSRLYCSSVHAYDLVLRNADDRYLHDLGRTDEPFPCLRRSSGYYGMPGASRGRSQGEERGDRT